MFNKNKKINEAVRKPIKETPLKELWRYYSPMARGDVLIATFVINILSLALPILTLQVYDRIIPQEAMATLSLLSIGLIVTVILDIFLKTVRAWLAAWTGARYEHNANRQAMNKVLNAQLEFMEKIPAGVHLERLSSIGPIRNFYASQTSLIMLDLPFSVIFLAVMAYVAGWLVAIPILLILISSYLALKVGKELRYSLAARLRLDENRFNFLIETLQGIHTIKSKALEQANERRHEKLMKKSAEIAYDTTYLSGVANTISVGLTQFSMISVVGIGSLLVIDKSLSIGGLAACILLTGRAINPFTGALGLWVRFQSVKVAENKLEELDSVPMEEDTGTVDEPINSVELRNVSFSYDKVEKNPVLKEINFSVRPGEIIAIGGKNGAGKSTLLRMLMGELDQDKGQYLINGKDGHDLTRESRARQMAYLSPHPTLLRGTILDNLTMFEDINIPAAHELVKKLGLESIFANMPDGLKTQVGNTAVDILPAGIVQRIAMVRALSSRPRLLLFDDANSMLDGKSDPLVRAVLEEYRQYSAIVIVSYQAALWENADRCYALEKGSLQPVAKPKKKIIEKAPVMKQTGKLSIDEIRSGDKK